MTKQGLGALSTAAMAVTATALAVVACGRNEPAKSARAEESSMALAPAARADAEMPKAIAPAAPPPAAQGAAAPTAAPQAAPDAKKEDVERAAAGAPRGPSPDERAASVRRARSDFERASRDVSVYANDCNLACRALASMDRAASHLCLLAESEDDRAQCDDARARTEAARRRVRATCGVCAAAPVPSP